MPWSVLPRRAFAFSVPSTTQFAPQAQGAESHACLDAFGVTSLASVTSQPHLNQFYAPNVAPVRAPPAPLLPKVRRKSRASDVVRERGRVYPE